MLVNFFATWCVPCRKEQPELIRFHHRDRSVGDLEVVGVVYADTADAVRDFRSDEAGDWPMLTDPAGVVVSKILGGVSAEDLEQLLQRAKAQETMEGNTS